MKTRVPFEKLDFAQSPRDLLLFEVARLREQLGYAAEGRFQATTYTRLTIFPKDTGESLNHLDPLRPRFGIEIEMRQPAASPNV